MTRRLLARAALLALSLSTLAAAAPQAPADERGGGLIPDSFSESRRNMVQQQLVERGFRDERLLEVMGEVPRHLFIPEQNRDQAYDDTPVPIGDGQSIHQPYLVARMTELLELDRGAKVLEIGTGSGYHSAILARLCRQVFSIEIEPDLAERARELLADLDIKNVHVKNADGYQGWPQEAPFDAIIVTTAPSHIPEPLLRQLKVGGKMVVPVGEVVQDLLLITKTEYGYEKRSTIPVNIAPMSGEGETGRP